ncbi:MAG: M20/M25/M40 family metallo-hydrolase [Pseudomonadota bacterium]
MIRVIASLLLSLSLAVSVSAQTPLSKQDLLVIDMVDGNSDAQLKFLEETVNQNSGTLNIKGVEAVGTMFDREFSALGFDTEWIAQPEETKRAGHFVARKHFGPGPHLLLIGHLDTVFEEFSPFQTFEIDGDVARGPGISDMKGGNTVILYALRALLEADVITQGTVTVFLTGDEESPGRPLSISRKDLIEAGKAADIALNFEGGSAEWAVIGRRGSSTWTLEVSAPQAHSSGIFREGVGAGAVFEMSRILNDFYEEVRGPFGLTFNPGMAAAGTIISDGSTPNDRSVYGKTNVIANSAIVRGGLRSMNAEQLEAARAAMREVVARNLPETSATITFTDGYPAMEETEANKALLQRLNTVHARLGLDPAKSFPPERRGAADISFVAPHVTSMDGLGVSGSGAHSLREVMDLASLNQATQRSALFIYDLLEERF